MVVFGILGMQLFQGLLRYRCYLDDGRAASEGSDEPAPGALPLGEQRGVCAPGGVPGARGTCAAGEACLFYGSNPVFGTISFDNIIDAWMTIFQCVT